MAMAIYTGALTELGPSVQTASERIASAQYTYISLSGGQTLRNISVVGGLDGKLDAALDDPRPVELHIVEGGKKADLLVAVKSADGQIFASDLGGGSVMGYSLVVGLVVLGLCLIPLFGVGLLLLWGAWRSWHGLRLVEAAKTHVRSLPNVILI